MEDHNYIKLKTQITRIDQIQYRTIPGAKQL